MSLSVINKWGMPSLEQMRADGVPPNVAWLKLHVWRFLPDVMLTPDGYSEEGVNFLTTIKPVFDNIKSNEDFRTFMDLAITTAMGKTQEEYESDAENFSSNFDLLREYVTKVSEFTGIQLGYYAIPQNYENLIKKSRFMAGESPRDLAKEEAEAWEKERKEEERRRNKERKQLMAAIAGEEFVDDEPDGEDEKPVSPQEASLPEEELNEEQKARRARKEELRVWGNIKEFAKELAQETDKEMPSDEQFADMDRRMRDFVEKFGLSSLRFAKNIGLEGKMKAMEDMEKHFSNIANALEMPTENVGFRGALNVFYGGEMDGTGGVYTPANSTLYISRIMGALVITHEWFHGLDFYLGKQAGQVAQAISHMDLSRRPPSSYLAPVFFAMGDLMDFLKGEYEEPSHGLDADKFKELFASWMNDLYLPELLKVSRDERKMNDAKRTMMFCQALDSGDLQPALFAREFVKLYAIRAQETEPKKTYIQGDMLLELAAGAELMVKTKFANFMKGEHKSFMLQFAEAMDKQQGRLYYAMPTEMMARLGEQFVFEKMGFEYPEHLSGQHACGPEKEELKKYFGAWVEKAKEYLGSPRMVNSRTASVKL